MLKHLGPIVATALVVLILLATSMPLMHWYEMERRWSGFEDNQALWESHRITDYEYTIQMDCLCEPPAGIPIRVVVRGGRTVDAFDSRNPDAGIIDMQGIPDTIPALFDEIHTSLESGPDVIEVRYDGVYGYPAAVTIDEFLDYDDDQITYSVSDFEDSDRGA